MLLVDYREGSHDLVAPLLKMGLPVDECNLPSGDIAFEGRGDGGKSTLIGIEFKKLDELVQSLRTERLQGHQLLKMRDAFNHSWLFIEGELTYDSQGRLLKRCGRKDFKTMPGGMTLSELYKRLFVLHLKGGLNWALATKRTDTLKMIESMYRTWTDKDADEHTSHIAAYQAPPLTPISDFRAAVKAWPGVGMKASLAAEKAFGGSLRRAATATEAEWAALETVDKGGKVRRLGAKFAAELRTFLR